MVLLTVKEWETQLDSAPTNWDVVVVDDEATCEIGYGENEKKSKFCRDKIDFTASLGVIDQAILSWVFRAKPIVLHYRYKFISGSWVQLEWWGSCKSHGNRCTVLLLRCAVHQAEACTCYF